MSIHLKHNWRCLMKQQVKLSELIKVLGDIEVTFITLCGSPIERYILELKYYNGITLKDNIEMSKQPKINKQRQ